MGFADFFVGEARLLTTNGLEMILDRLGTMLGPLIVHFPNQRVFGFQSTLANGLDLEVKPFAFLKAANDFE